MKGGYAGQDGSIPDERPGIQAKYVDMTYQAKSWNNPRRVIAKIEWHVGELFPRCYFIVTNFKLPPVRCERSTAEDGVFGL